MDHVISEPCALDFNVILSDSWVNNTDDSTPTPYELNNLKCLYWETDELLNSPLHKHNDLLIHFNIQCLQAKFDSLITFMRSLSHDSVNNLPIVLALSETWLNESNNETFKIKGYQPIVSNFRRDN